MINRLTPATRVTFATVVILGSLFAWRLYGLQGLPAATTLQAQEIEKIVRDYLLKNPEVVAESLAALERKRENAQAAAAQTALAQYQVQLYNDSEAPVGGNPRGDVTIVEFFDYRCGYCRRVHPAVANVLQKDAKVRIIYKEFPILGPPSVLAARAALASRTQGKYLAFHTALMSGGGSFSEAEILKEAASVGLDAERLKKDMASPEIEKIIEKNHALAQALNIRGTPAFIVGKRLVPGAMEEADLAALVQETRAGK
ncbi:MAG: DsbA family protein [Candidatus Tectomicrobia bacterium]|nr:DsbA family protein [Candidatus Tectomicrobia bacterium]